MYIKMKLEKVLRLRKALFNFFFLSPYRQLTLMHYVQGANHVKWSKSQVQIYITLHYEKGLS